MSGAGVAVITGSSRGIGRAIAVKLAHLGCDVVINDSGEGATDGRRVVEEVQSAGRRAVYIPADVSDEESVQELFRLAEAELGPVRIAVTNAGVQINKAFLDLEPASFDHVMAVNLRGCFLCAQAAAKRMKAAGGGKILTISSIRARRAFPNSAAYAASKAGIEALTRIMAIDLAPYNIQVNCIAPGSVETAFNADVLSDPGYRASVLRKIPSNRFGTPDDVAHVAAFLVSEEADWITGTVVTVDGGQTIFS